MDITALTTVLEADRYVAAVQDGNNGILTTLLNEDDMDNPSVRWRGCSLEDFMSALGAESLTAPQLNQLQLYAPAGHVPCHKSGVQAWVEAQFPGWDTATETAILTLVEKNAPYALTALDENEDKVSIRDVRQAVRGLGAWFGSGAAIASRVADKAPRAVVEAARVARITADVDAEGARAPRARVLADFTTESYGDQTAARRRSAEIYLRVREDRIANPEG